MTAKGTQKRPELLEAFWPLRCVGPGPQYCSLLTSDPVTGPQLTPAELSREANDMRRAPGHQTSLFI